MTFQEAVLKARSAGGALKFGRRGTWSKMTELEWGNFAQEAPFSFIDCILADDWEVAPRTMDFATAMKHLQGGKTVKRAGWSFSIGPNSRNELIVSGDAISVKATDWEVVG